MKRDFSSRSFFTVAVVLLVASATTATSRATTILDFEGLQDSEQIAGFYAGGAGSLGSTGPNLGVSFSGDAVALISSGAPGGGTTSFKDNPSGDTILHFGGPNAFMNVPGGFTGGFSLYYAPTQIGTVNVYDGLNGQGNLLGSLAITSSQPGHAWYFKWFTAGVSFSGIARSVSFADATSMSAFDNLTLGSDVPAPEPSTIALLVIAGIAVLGFTWRRPLLAKRCEVR